MFDKLKGVEDRFLEIEKKLSDPEVVNDRETYQRVVREHADLNKIVTVYENTNGCFKISMKARNC